MKPIDEQIRQIVRNERLKSIRLFFFVLGSSLLLTALLTLGIGGMANIKSASSIFSTLAISGHLRPFAMPIAIFGLCAFIPSIVITITLRLLTPSN